MEAPCVEPIQLGVRAREDEEQSIIKTNDMTTCAHCSNSEKQQATLLSTT